MIPAAIFLPTDPEARAFDLVELARAGCQKGLRLYTNGRQLALLPRPAKGWALFAAKLAPTNPHPPEAA